MTPRIVVTGDFAEAVEDGVRERARDLRDGVSRAGRSLQAELRGQTTKALKRGQGIANAWRERTYPANPLTPTLHPASYVWTRAPNVILAFEEGKTITVKRGKYLCWPTGFNAVGGRRNAGSRGGVRVTPEEMVAAKGQAVVLRSRTKGVLLWCLRVRQASSRGGKKGRGRGRAMLLVGNRNVQVLTGKMKAGERAERAREIATRGVVPMFFLARSVNPGKRLDVEGAANRASGTLAASL